MSGSGQENPRMPRDLQGLFKFALETTRSEDPTHASDYEQMSPERRQFLEDALKSLTIDVVEQLSKAMMTLMDKSSSEEDQVQSLEVVTNFVEDIDTANDFFKIGGFSIIHPCLNSKYPDVRAETSSLIAELAQNNPFCQQKLLDENVLPKLIELLTDQTEVAVKAFHAISCMVRSYEPALASFIEIGGLECILGLVQFKDQEKLVIKSMFLISAFAKDFPAVGDELVKLNAIERIIAAIEPKDDYDTKLELALAALNDLARNESAIDRCRQGNLNLKDKLNRIIKLGKGKEDCKEQIEYSQKLIKKIFN